MELRTETLYACGSWYFLAIVWRSFQAMAKKYQEPQAKSVSVLSSIGSTGRFRRTHGPSPYVLMAASEATP